MSGRGGWGAGFVLSASDFTCIDSWKKERVPRTPQSIWPHPPPPRHISTPFYLPSNPPPALQKKGRAGESAHVRRVCYSLCALVCLCVSLYYRELEKADAMNPGGCLGGFISHCVSRCSGDGRKLFMGMKTPEWAGEIFLFTTALCACMCVCS